MLPLMHHQMTLPLHVLTLYIRQDLTQPLHYLNLLILSIHIGVKIK